MGLIQARVQINILNFEWRFMWNTDMGIFGTPSQIAC